MAGPLRDTLDPNSSILDLSVSEDLGFLGRDPLLELSNSMSPEVFRGDTLEAGHLTLCGCFLF